LGNWHFWLNSVITRRAVKKVIMRIYRNLVQKSKLCFGRKARFWSKIEISSKNRNLARKSKTWSNIEILFEIRNFGRKMFIRKLEKILENSQVETFRKIVWNPFGYPVDFQGQDILSSTTPVTSHVLYNPIGLNSRLLMITFDLTFE